MPEHHVKCLLAERWGQKEGEKTALLVFFAPIFLPGSLARVCALQTGNCRADERDRLKRLSCLDLEDNSRRMLPPRMSASSSGARPITRILCNSTSGCSHGPSDPKISFRAPARLIAWTI